MPYGPKLSRCIYISGKDKLRYINGDSLNLQKQILHSGDGEVKMPLSRDG